MIEALEDLVIGRPVVGEYKRILAGSGRKRQTKSLEQLVSRSDSTRRRIAYSWLSAALAP